MSNDIETELTRAIDRAFAPSKIRVFLTDLQARDTRINYIEESGADLTPYFGGGPIGKGEGFEISFVSRDT